MAMAWSNQTVLVTGAGGFIGSHLVERLAALGARTRALIHYNSAGSWGWLDSSAVRDDIEVVAADIRDGESLGRAFEGVDAVFHLAALIAIPYSYQAPLSYVRTNVEGTLNVLQAALRAGVSLVVHTSTSETYGTARYVPIDEDHPLQGQSPYAASKIGADKLAEAFHRTFQLPVATLRPFNTYGPRQSSRAVIPAIITQALTQSEVRLGNVSPTRDFNYVADTVEGFIRMAGAPAAVGQVVNLGTGEEVSIEHMVREILTLVGRDIPLVVDPDRMRPDSGEVERLCADNRRACEMLGWSPQHTLRDGLLQTIRWVEANLARYRVGAYTL